MISLGSGDAEDMSIKYTVLKWMFNLNCNNILQFYCNVWSNICMIDFYNIYITNKQTANNNIADGIQEVGIWIN